MRSHYEYRTPLYFAVRENRLAVARFLLDRGANPFYNGNDLVEMARIRRLGDMEALIESHRPKSQRIVSVFERVGQAVRSGDTAWARKLLDGLSARGSSGDIWTAAYVGHVKRVRELLDRDPEVVNRAGEGASGTLLVLAAGRGHLEVVRLLLERGADPNVPEEGNAPHGRALYSAVYIRHVDVARVLLEHGANPNQEVESSADAPSIAIMNSDTKMIELLAEPSGGFPCNSQIHSMGWPSTLSYQQVAATGITRSLVVLASYGDLDTARAVLADDPALADDPEALAAAATNGHEAIVRLLLRHRPRLAGRVAVVARSRELTELLFQNGMNPDLTGWLGVTPRHRFARQGDVDKAAIFLDHGANLHARDEELCTTPLGYAAYAGKLRMVEFLLRRGAKPTLPDDLAWATPIALATYRGHDAVVRVLEAHAS